MIHLCSHEETFGNVSNTKKGQKSVQYQLSDIFLSQFCFPKAMKVTKAITSFYFWYIFDTFSVPTKSTLQVLNLSNNCQKYDFDRFLILSYFQGKWLKISKVLLLTIFSSIWSMYEPALFIQISLKTQTPILQLRLDSLKLAKYQFKQEGNGPMDLRLL